MVAHETTSAYSSEELTLACSALAFFFTPVEQGEDLQGCKCMATSSTDVPVVSGH